MATAALQGPLVDSHAHIWEADMPFAANAWTRPAYVYTAEQFLADMHDAGVRYGVVAAASLFGTYNDYTIRSLRRYGNLRGTAILDPAVDPYTLAAMRADGIVGCRLQWFMLDPLPDIRGEIFQRFCRRLRDLGMHLHLNIEGSRMTGVARALAGTGVRLVIDHFGWHDPGPRLQARSYQDMLRLMEAGNVWIKLASGFRRPDRDLPAQYTQDLLSRFGTEKLLWGSDSPFVGHEHAATYRSVVEDLHYAVPDEATRRALGESAYRFYFA
ncbi:MAG TPA: amidohydrolase family protein [Steroidobacteraceae bacterium]|nr:amidohydrolase family protein [Steroidobacteraceae bacterium]